ncbi:hypothetical protein NQ317_019598 [Molorchus minor]|uniref:PiggyBac transposable element-derived protein domain-containing protein n=1 Tax=Molorchus minor TaxID=1323400 RepID=A0ABQ9J598_9CUCU|nr:hypothetical protein NQ317_019598 [Molorchus minor]
MILFKGRSTHKKQYNPQKPIKRGYKIWCVADQLGYVCNFDVYQGVEVHKIVYFDNYFTSIPLLEKLCLKKYVSLWNHKIEPLKLMINLLKRGGFDYRYSNTNIGVFKWKDKSSGSLLATNFHVVKSHTEVKPKPDAQTVVHRLQSSYGRCGSCRLAKNHLRARNRWSKKWWAPSVLGFSLKWLLLTFIIYSQLQEVISTLEFRRSVSRGLMNMIVNAKS